MSTDEPQDEQTPEESPQYDLGRAGTTPAFDQYVQLRASDLDAKLASFAAAANHATDIHSHIASTAASVMASYEPVDVAFAPAIALPNHERRAADASELTVRRLEIMVDAMMAAADREQQRDAAAAERDRAVDSRERVMLRWTQASVLLAAVAAVAAIITIVIG